MSRSNYTDDLDQRDMNLWRGTVASVIRGKRGQAFLRELATELANMKEKRLISDALYRDGEACAIGVVGQKRHLDLSTMDPDDPGPIAAAFEIPCALVQEIAYINDEAYYAGPETPEERHARVLAWVEKQIQPKEG